MDTSKRTALWVDNQQTADMDDDYLVYKISKKGKEKVINALKFDLDSNYHSIIESVVSAQDPYILRDKLN